MGAGIGLSLNIAKSALFTSQSNLAVAGHNVSNVATEGYSRQRADQSATMPLRLYGLNFGTGVETMSVVRDANQLLENRIVEQKAVLSGHEESKAYMNVVEASFNEKSENSLSKNIAHFWSSWHELSNATISTAGRTDVYERGVELATQMNELNDDLNKVDFDLTREIHSATEQINSISKSIAILNEEIRGLEFNSSANDQRDARNFLVGKLAELIDVKTFEQDNGEIVVYTAGGYQLVNGADPFKLINAADRITWEGSDGNIADITDKINGGKIGGWLRMRDEVVTKYKTELKLMTKEMIWQVNKQHSQGVGLQFLPKAVTGTYSTDTDGKLSTLAYGNKIDYEKDFKMWLRENSTVPPTTSSLEVDMSISTAKISNLTGANNDGDYKYRFTVTTAGTVGPGSDDPVVEWEKLNTDGTVTGSKGTLGPITGAGSYQMDGGTIDIAEGFLVSGNTFTLNASKGESDPLKFRGFAGPPVTPSEPHGRANSVSDTYTFRVVKGGDIKDVNLLNPIEIRWSNSVSNGVVLLKDPKELVFEVDGMTVPFKSGTLFDGDLFTLHTNERGFPQDKDGNPAMNYPENWHWTIQSFADEFNRHTDTLRDLTVPLDIVATVTATNKIRFSPAQGTSFAFADSDFEDSGVAAALGINTFFEGSGAASIGVNKVLGDINNIAAAKIDGTGTRGSISDFGVIDPSFIPMEISAANENNKIIFIEDDGSVLGPIGPIEATIPDSPPGGYTSYDQLRSVASEIEKSMEEASKARGRGLDYKVSFDEHTKKFRISEGDGSDLRQVNVLWSQSNAADTLGFDPFDETYTVSDGDYGHGDNRNSLGIADQQFETSHHSNWSFRRGEPSSSDTVETTVEGFYQGLISSLGIESASIDRGFTFSEGMIEKLEEQRDNISGVSLDEEMIQLMKFQQSYNAASKLLKTADEMLTSLLAIR